MPLCTALQYKVQGSLYILTLSLGFLLTPSLLSFLPILTCKVGYFFSLSCNQTTCRLILVVDVEITLGKHLLYGATNYIVNVGHGKPIFIVNNFSNHGILTYSLTDTYKAICWVSMSEPLLVVKRASVSVWYLVRQLRCRASILCVLLLISDFNGKYFVPTLLYRIQLAHASPQCHAFT